MDRYELRCGDSLKLLKTLADNSVDALVTDPPAGIAFMNKAWDGDKGGKRQWKAWLESIARECLRVLKPGAYGLVWSLPKTSHWTGDALEDAGFDVVSQVVHLFGSGFPKGQAVGKMMDKKMGLEREVVGTVKKVQSYGFEANNTLGGSPDKVGLMDVTAPASELSAAWEGFNTGIKPAHEIWWLVQKPISEKTIVANVLKWGTGALNIDGCRVGEDVRFNPPAQNTKYGNSLNMSKTGMPLNANGTTAKGRYPSTLIHDGSDAVLSVFPETNQTGGGRKGENGTRTYLKQQNNRNAQCSNLNPDNPNAIWDAERQDWYVLTPTHNDDTGGNASRYFYCAKISPKDRNQGCEHLFWRDDNGHLTQLSPEQYAELSALPETERPTLRTGNPHPTVKPVNLMRYLCRLITPPNGLILDPFLGSGSTGKAAMLEGFSFIGFDLDPNFVTVATARIEHALNNPDKEYTPPKTQAPQATTKQGKLF